MEARNPDEAALGLEAGPGLEAVLNAFREKVNGHARLKGLLKGWNPSIIIAPDDDARRFTLAVADARIAEVAAEEREGAHTIRVEGGLALLASIFSGAANPARAVLDGTLRVFGTDKDQVKLDGISLVLWGM